MKQLRYTFPVVLLVFAAGCPPKPADVSPQAWRVVTAQDDYSYTVVGCTTVRNLGFMKDDAARKVETARQGAALALDAYKANELGAADFRVLVKVERRQCDDRESC